MKKLFQSSKQSKKYRKRGRKQNKRRNNHTSALLGKRTRPESIVPSTTDKPQMNQNENNGNSKTNQNSKDQNAQKTLNTKNDSKVQQKNLSKKDNTTEKKVRTKDKDNNQGYLDRSNEYFKRLESSKFRMLNEFLYTSNSDKAQAYFSETPTEFDIVILLYLYF